MGAFAHYAAEAERHPTLNSTRCTPAEAERGIAKLCRHFKIPHPSVSFTSGRNSSLGGREGFWYVVKLNKDTLNWLLVAHELGHVWDVYRLSQRGEKVQRWHCKRHDRLVTRLCRYIEKKGWHLGALKKPGDEPKAKVPKRKPLTAWIEGDVTCVRLSKTLRGELDCTEVEPYQFATEEERARASLDRREFIEAMRSAQGAVVRLTNGARRYFLNDAHVCHELRGRMQSVCDSIMLARPLPAPAPEPEPAPVPPEQLAAKAQERAADRERRIEQRRAQVARLERKIKALTTRLKKARRSLAALERAASKSNPQSTERS